MKVYVILENLFNHNEYTAYIKYHFFLYIHIYFEKNMLVVNVNKFKYRWI